MELKKPIYHGDPNAFPDPTTGEFLVGGLATVGIFTVLASLMAVGVVMSIWNRKDG